MDSDQIHFRAEFTIEEEKTEEFTKLIQDMSRTVEANEPDTLEYKFYLNRNKTNCIAHEIQKPQLLIITVLRLEQYFLEYSIFPR